MGKLHTGDSNAVKITAHVALICARERVITPLLQAGTIEQQRLTLL
jgi:hypothetical protein